MYVLSLILIWNKIFKTQWGSIIQFKFYNTLKNDLGSIKKIHSLWTKQCFKREELGFQKTFEGNKILLTAFKIFNLVPDI